MKYLIALPTLVFAQAALAIPLTIESCREAGIRTKTIVEMRSFSNGQIKLFAHDLEEPAGAPMGIQIIYERGNEPNVQNFCVYVRGLSGISLKNAHADYDERTNTLYVNAPGRRYFPENDEFGPTLIGLTIRKEGARAADIFSASAR